MENLTEPLLQYAILPGESYNSARSVLFSSLQPNVFRDEAHILYSVAYKFRAQGIILDEEFLKIYLSRNLGELIRANRKYIDLSAYAELAKEVDSSLLQGDATDNALLYIGGVIEYFNSLLSLPAPDASLESVATAIEKFRLAYSTASAEESLRKGLTILTTGIQQGTKFLHGFTDASEFVRKELSYIDGFMDAHQGMGYVDMVDLISNKEETRPVRKISDWGGITKLTDHFGGIFSQSLINVMAPHKGGKTKFCLDQAYNAVVNYGQNVTLWPVEGSLQEMVAELAAIHFDRTYNAGQIPEESMLGVTKQVIMQDRWDELGHPEWKELCDNLVLDLATNPQYGRISFIDKPLVLETFIDDLDLSVDSNFSSLIVIDYLTLGTSLRKMDSHEVIRKLYQMASSYVKRKNVAIITPVQYKQETISSLVKGTDSADMRTSASGSAEVLRSADISIALWATTEELQSGQMHILSLPSRITQTFPKIDLVTDLGCSLFLSKN